MLSFLGDKEIECPFILLNEHTLTHTQTRAHAEVGLRRCTHAHRLVTQTFIKQFLVRYEQTNSGILRYVQLCLQCVFTMKCCVAAVCIHFNVLV